MVNNGLSPEQVQQFHDDGFLIVRDLLPNEALQPLIEELVDKVDDLTNQAVAQGLVDSADTFPDAPFATRLALVSQACSDHNWLWRQIQGKGHKTAGMFTLRTFPCLLDVAEALIGPEIYAHPQSTLRAKLPGQIQTVVPWHQDLAYLSPEDAGETLFVNFWIPLVPATAANGCMQVIRGSNKLGLLRHVAAAAIPEPTASRGIDDADLPDGELVTCQVAPGDVLLTMEYVLHRSIPNTSDTVRWSVDIRYSELGLPTGRDDVSGFVARSIKNPKSVARSHRDCPHP
jgi:phytanoyl-CoA hydroxylase